MQGFTDEVAEGVTPVFTSTTNIVFSVDKYTHNGVEAYLMTTDVDVGPGQFGVYLLHPALD